MDRIRKINQVFLFTVLITIVAPLIPLNLVIRNNIGLLVASQILIVIPSLLYLVSDRINYKEAVRFKKIRPITVVLLILLTIFLIPVMSFVNALSLIYVKDSTTQTMTMITQNTPFLISLFGIALVPCILEESVYRGIMYNEYSKYNKIGAILLSAFLFGILHGNFNQFSYAFIMGILFALIIEATDSIISTMIIHFIINGNSVTLLYLVDYLKDAYNAAVQNGDSSTASLIENAIGTNNLNPNEIAESASAAIQNTTIAQVIVTYGPIALISGLVAFFIYRTIAMKEHRWEHVKQMFSRNTREKSVNIFTKNNLYYFIPLIFAVSICVILMILSEIKF